MLMELMVLGETREILRFAQNDKEGPERTW